jgi:predicted alpha/beta superfamily hydrolase
LVKQPQLLQTQHLFIGLRSVLCTAFLIASSFCHAQITITLITIPNNTPENAKIFIAGNFNDWVPDAEEFRFKKNSKGNYFIDLPTANKFYEYKITLGTWNSCEMSPKGGDIPNRKIFAGKDTALQLSIENWKSIETLLLSNQQNPAFVFSENFPMPQLNNTRRIWIYLPTDYATNLNKRYPVLYMHDGQNLFENAAAYNGEWEVDETLKELQNKGDSGVIVVGIDNGGAARIDEYSPWKNLEYGGGKGKEYLDFVSYSLKPVIDLLYRTKADRANTAMMGSSMAGLITLYAAYNYSKTFSKFGVFSPSLWFSDSIYRIPKTLLNPQQTKIYLMSGILESAQQAQETYTMRDSLYKHGFTNVNLRCEIKNDGTHSEWFWKREFANCYSWLFKKTPITFPMREK